MASRPVYLAKHRLNKRQRAHFAIFIPNTDCSDRDAGQDLAASPRKGTVINVVGEPLMAGYALEIKRDYDCGAAVDLEALIFLGHADGSGVHEAGPGEHGPENTPRGQLEREAAAVAPPPRGQDVRAPIDGVRTRRCQEWAVEYLTRLVDRGLVSPGAVAVAQGERDVATHGIFGRG